MADIIKLLRTDVLVDEKGIATIKFSNFLDNLTAASNETIQIVQQNIEVLSGAGAVRSTVSNLSKQIKDLSQLIDSADTNKLRAKLMKLEKKVNELEQLV